MVRPLNPFLVLRRDLEESESWSPTGLEDFLRCPRRRYLHKKHKKKLTWPDFAKGIHLHRKIEELRLHRIREKPPRYKSAEAFANVIANDWQRTPISEGEIEGNKILWEYEKQPYTIKEEIRQIGKRFYPILMEEEKNSPPIIFTYLTKKRKVVNTTAYEFDFSYKDRGLNGEIDEIRKEEDKIIIRDYKSGKWKYVENKIAYAFQPTEYEFAVCLLCLTNETFRKAIGITNEQVQEWIKNPELMSNNVVFEYFMLDKPSVWDKEKKEWVEVERNPIIYAERNEFHYKELCLNINTANAIKRDMTEQRYYTPIRGQHCNRCFYQKECEDLTNRTNANLKQITLQVSYNRTKKNYITKLKTEKPQATQTQFDFMKGVKKAYKPKSSSN